MPSSNCPAPSAKRDDDALTNVTALIHDRFQSSLKEDWERLMLCWGYSDCGDCHRSEGFCGWCAVVGSVFSFLNPLLRPPHGNAVISDSLNPLSIVFSMLFDCVGWILLSRVFDLVSWNLVMTVALECADGTGEQTADRI